MSKTRRNFSSEQKTRIVLEILQEDKTLNQVASRYEISPRVLQNWKKQFLDNASLVFEPSRAVKEYKAELEKLKNENDELAKKLGRTTIERDFLQNIGHYFVPMFLNRTCYKKSS